MKSYEITNTILPGSSLRGRAPYCKQQTLLRSNFGLGRRDYFTSLRFVRKDGWAGQLAMTAMLIGMEI